MQLTEYLSTSDTIPSSANIATVPLSEHLQIVKRGKIDNSIMHIHDHSLSWLGTDTPITSVVLSLSIINEL
jgi:hypothetical protein